MKRYTLDAIENKVFWLTRSNETENTSALIEDEISMNILEYFINEGITLCNDADGFICYDGYEKPLVDIYNDTINNEYERILQENQKTPFTEIAKFFGW